METVAQTIALLLIPFGLYLIYNALIDKPKRHKRMVKPRRIFNDLEK